MWFMGEEEDQGPEDAAVFLVLSLCPGTVGHAHQRGVALDVTALDHDYKHIISLSQLIQMT